MASEDAAPVSSVMRPTFTSVEVTPGALAVFFPVEAPPTEPEVPPPETVPFEELLHAANKPTMPSSARAFPVRRFIPRSPLSIHRSSEM